MSLDRRNWIIVENCEIEMIINDDCGVRYVLSLPFEILKKCIFNGIYLSVRYICFGLSVEDRYDSCRNCMLTRQTGLFINHAYHGTCNGF